MLGDSLELETKKELQELLDKLERNVSGVGSEKLLKEKYPVPYNKLMQEICDKLNEYINNALSHIETSISAEEIQKLWSGKKKEIRNAIKRYSTDDIREIIYDYVFELAYTYQNKVMLGYEINDDESLSA